MTLKQIKPEQRILFLELFTKELIISILKEEQTKKRIEIEKLKRKFSIEGISPEEAFKKIITTPVIPIQEHKTKEINENKNLIPFKKPISMRERYNFKPVIGVKKEILSQFEQKEPETIKSFQLQPAEKPEGFNLGKIDPLLKDSFIKMIECEGPEKELLIKKNGRIFKTKESLNQNEISEIINSFSKEARIPIIGGIFKAIVGDLIISALISEFAGSKFIITRMDRPLIITKK